MSERNELQDLVAEAYGSNNRGWLSVEAADKILAAGYRKSRTITTTKELEALPVDSVVKDRPGDIYERVENPDSERPWWRAPGIRGYLVTASILFPATILFEGEAA
jgi:hypothetical protein